MPTRTSARPNRRQLQAEATRRDILVAARRLFAEHGYAATSMAAIAEAAGAAVQTIYDSVGPKRAILLALLDVIDEEAGVGPMWRRAGELADPGELLALGVRLTRQFVERGGDVLGNLAAAAAIEADVADALAEGGRRHRAGTRRLAGRLADLGALRPELSPDRAGDILGLLTSGEVYRQLTRDFGWSFDDCEAWITATLAAQLLGHPPPPGADDPVS